MRGLPFCTTMLALIEKGEVIFSIVYDFINNDIYWAEKGHGAFKNDTRIHVSDRTLTGSYICVETNTAKDENRIKLAQIDASAGYFHSICAGWEFVMVACGKLDGRVGFDPWGKDYDFALGSLIVSEAGGTVTNAGLTTYDYKNRNHVMANPKIHAELNQLFDVKA